MVGRTLKSLPGRKIWKSPQNRTEPGIFQELRLEKENEGKGGLR